MSKIKFAVITILLLSVLFPIQDSDAQNGKDEKRTMNVTGRGEIFITPDVANISFSVETKAKTASAAVKENASKSSKLMETLKSNIGKEDKLSTTGYSLTPVYEYNSQTKKSEFKGYRASNVVMVKTHNLENLGNLIDSAANAGANNIQGLSFDTTKRDEYRREALVKAVQDAKTTADTVASAAGVKLSQILQISPSYDYPVPVYRDYNRKQASFAEATSTPIEAGEISVKASVTMLFGIQ